MDLSVGNIYLRYKTKFTSVDEYLDFLIKAAREDKNLIYYKTRPKKIHWNEIQQVDEAEANKSLDYFDYEEFDEVDLVKSEDVVENEKIDKDREILIGKKELEKYFVSRNVAFSSEELVKLIDKDRVTLYEYFSSMNQDDKRAHKLIRIDAKDALVLEDDSFYFSELLVNSKRWEEFLGRISDASRILKKYVSPSDDYRSAKILLNGKPEDETYNENQATILKYLYEGTLENPSYVLSYDEIKTITKYNSDDSIKPGSSFKKTMIREYLASEKRCFVWKLPKD